MKIVHFDGCGFGFNYKSILFNLTDFSDVALNAIFSWFTLWYNMRKNGIN